MVHRQKSAPNGGRIRSFAKREPPFLARWAVLADPFGAPRGCVILGSARASRAVFGALAEHNWARRESRISRTCKGCGQEIKLPSSTSSFCNPAICLTVERNDLIAAVTYWRDRAFRSRLVLSRPPTTRCASPTRATWPS